MITGCERRNKGLEECE